jgi:hypothetical protein
MRISSRQIIKVAGPKEKKKAGGINFDFAQKELGKSGGEISKDTIQRYLEQNKDGLPFSDDDLLKIEGLNLSESARKRVNEEESFFLIAGAITSKEDERASISSINEFLERSEFKPGDLKAKFMSGVNFSTPTSIITEWNNFYASVKKEEEEIRKKELDSKRESYLSDEVVYNFGDGWKVVYVPAAGEMEEFPGLPRTSHDRILEGNKNGLCLGSISKYYQTNRDGKIFSVRDPRNSPQVTIRILNNKLEEAKGKQNKSPIPIAAGYAKSWLNTIQGLDYKDCYDYLMFPPEDSESAKRIFLKSPYAPYEGGWIVHWYKKGIEEIDNDVQNKIENNDYDVLALASKYKDLVQPVVQHLLAGNEGGHSYTLNSLFETYNLHKIYKDLPEMIRCGKIKAKTDPTLFMRYFKEEPWAEQYIPKAIEKIIRDHPTDLVDYFRDDPWAKPYILDGIRAYIKQYPDEFSEMIHQDWTKEYLPTIAETYSKENPIYTLSSFINEPWAQDYILASIKNSIDTDPQGFIAFFEKTPWAQEYLPLAGEALANRDYKLFLKSYSKYSWSGPGIKISLEKEAEDDPISLLYRAIDDPSDEDYIPLVKDYLPEVAKEYIKRDPQVFLKAFGKKDWANKKIDNLKGKSYVDFAMELLSKKSSYSPRLLKLSKMLLSLGLLKESDQILKV